MSWSLRLPPRRSPAVLLGVSQGILFAAHAPKWKKVLVPGSLNRPLCAGTPDSPKQLSATCGAHLALGVATQFEELPITAA